MTYVRLLRINARQALQLRRMFRLVDRQCGRIRLLEKERDEARADAELVLSLVPEDRRRDACALVRTRHQIASWPEIEEADT